MTLSDFCNIIQMIYDLSSYPASTDVYISQKDPDSDTETLKSIDSILVSKTYTAPTQEPDVKIIINTRPDGSTDKITWSTPEPQIALPHIHSSGGFMDDTATTICKQPVKKTTVTV